MTRGAARKVQAPPAPPSIWDEPRGRPRTLEHNSWWGPWRFECKNWPPRVRYHGGPCPGGCIREEATCAVCGPTAPCRTVANPGNRPKGTYSERPTVCRGAHQLIGGRCNACGDGYDVVITMASSDGDGLRRWLGHVKRKPWATKEVVQQLDELFVQFSRRFHRESA